MPNAAKIISHFALLKCIFEWSCNITTSATSIDIITANGTAVEIGMKRLNNGTAISASPNPNVERNKVAANAIHTTRKIIVTDMQNELITKY